MEMFQLDFIQRALMAGLAISCITPILGLLLILKRQSMLADTLSHVSLAGVALGMMLHVSPTLMTLVVVIVASLLLEYLRLIYRDFSDVAVAIMMAAGMSIALVLMNLNRNATNFKIEQFLFGSIILISPEEVTILGILAAVLVFLYVIFRKPLYVLSFDEATAHTVGLPVKAMSMLISVVTGVTISVMMPIVGALLVSALVVLPAATAIKVSRSFTQTIIIGFVLNVIGIVSGLMASYHLNTPPGASITLGFIVLFVVVSVVQLVWRYLHRQRIEKN